MKKIVKVLSLLVSICIVLSMFCFSVFASNGGEMTVTGDDKFTGEWEYSLTFTYRGMANWTMYYGYDTDWIHEDYTWTISSTGTSQSFVFREGYDSEPCDGPVKNAGKYSKIEVTHRKSTVKYSCSFSSMPETGIVIYINPSKIKK